MSTATSEEYVADDDDELKDDNESEQPTEEGNGDWTMSDDDSMRRNKMWLFAVLGLVAVIVLWLVWRSKHDEVKRAAKPVLKNLQSGASQAQDFLGTAWDRASETSSQMARNIAGSEPVRTVASTVNDAPSTVADSLDELSRKLRERKNS